MNFFRPNQFEQMTTQKQQILEPQQAQMLRIKNSGMINHVGSPLPNEDRDEEMTRSALAAFRAKEDEIERRKTEVREKVQAQLGRVEEETKRLAEIREVSWKAACVKHDILIKKTVNIISFQEMKNIFYILMVFD